MRSRRRPCRAFTSAALPASLLKHSGCRCIVPAVTLALPFDYGATYVVRVNLDALRDRFVAGERLVYWSTAVSAYDGYRGWFFRQIGSRVVRSWDVEGAAESARAGEWFERAGDPDPAIASARAGDAEGLEVELRSRPIDVLAMELAFGAAVEAGVSNAAVYELLVRNSGFDATCQLALLHAAASNGVVTALEPLHASGIAIDQADDSGHTALLHATYAEHVDAARWLVARGADPARTTAQGNSPRSFAALRKNADLIDLFDAVPRRASAD